MIFTKTKTISGALFLILLVAGSFRLFGLQWGLPHHYHSDEDVMMYWAEAIRTRPVASLTDHPYFYVYGPLPLYWTAMGGIVLDRFLPPDTPSSRRVILLYTWARLLSAVLGTLTCLVVFLTAAMLSRPIMGLVAAFLLAVTPIHIRNSHFFTAEIPFTFFVSILLLGCLQVCRQPSRKWALVGSLAAGLALLCKYTALIYFPALWICMVMGWMRNRRIFPKTPLPGIAIYLLFIPVTGLLLFFAADPWIFLNPDNFFRTYRMLKEWSGGIRTPLWTAQFHDLIPGWYWITSLLPTGFGRPILLAAAGGCIVTFLRKERVWSALWLTSLFYFFLVGFSYMQYIRYTVPLAPAIVLAAALGLEKSRHWAVSFHRNAGNVFWTILFLVVLGFTAFKGTAYLHIYTEPDTRDEASSWLHKTFPENTVLLTDNSAYRPPIGRERFQVRLHSNLVIRGAPDLEYKNFFTVRLLDCYNFLYRKDLTPDDRVAYIQERLEGVDVIVFGEEAYEQFRHVRSEYPEVVGFYERLFEGGYGFRFQKVFRRTPSLFGLEWDDSDAELTWRLFDHPTIRILAKEVPIHGQ